MRRATAALSSGRFRPDVSHARDLLLQRWGTPDHAIERGPGQLGKQFTFANDPRWLRGAVVTVFGGNGILGQSVLAQLGHLGAQVIVPYRRNPGGRQHGVQHIRRHGLNSTTVVEYDPTSFDELLSLVKRSTMVINLIGRPQAPSLTNNQYMFGFEAVFKNLPRNIARASAMSGVERFVHISHVNAQPGIDSYPLRMKLEGEVEVLREFPNATIIKPTDIAAFNSTFFQTIQDTLDRDQAFPVRKLDKVVQPVSAQDLGAAIVRAAMDPRYAGRKFELGGPKKYNFTDIVRWVGKIIRTPVRFTTLPPYWRIFKTEQLRQSGVGITGFFYDELQRDTVVHEGAASWADLQMDPSKLIEADDVTNIWLTVHGRQVRDFGSYADYIKVDQDSVNRDRYRP